MPKASIKQLPVSVIIPSYNCAPYLGNAIDSCLRQSVQPLEVIVVDDGSTDDTESVLQSYENTPSVTIRRQENEGVSAARNAGVRLSRGEYVAFLDADDEFLPGDFEKKVEVIVRNPDIDVFFCDYMRSDIPGLMHRGFPALNAEKIFQSYSASCGDDIIRLSAAFSKAYASGRLNQTLIWTAAVVLRRRLFDKVGGFRPHLKVAEDLDLWRRCLAGGRAAVIRNHCGAIYFRWRGTKEQIRNRMSRKSRQAKERSK